MNSFAVTFLLVFFVFPMATRADSMPFEDCGSVFYLESIEISGCSVYPCRFQIGTSVNVTVNFLVQGRVSNSIGQLIQNVYFVISSIQLRANVTPDPCTAVLGSPQTTCTLKNGDRLKYQALINVVDVPPLPAKLYWTIRDEAAGQMVVCYKMTVILSMFY